MNSPSSALPRRHSCPSVEAFIVSLLLLFLLVSVDFVAAIMRVDVALGDPSGYTLSGTTQPRAIKLNMCFDFSKNTVHFPASGSATIALYNYPGFPANTYRLRARTSVTNTGTFNSGTKQYTISLRYVVEHVTATEAQAWPGVKRLTVWFGAPYDTKMPTSCGASMQFEKVILAEYDTVPRTYAAAKTRCEGTNGGFLASWLKTTERTLLYATINSGTVDLWHGAWVTDPRGIGDSSSVYCFREDPDFDANQCSFATPSYYNFVKTTCDNAACAVCTTYCARMAGLACLPNAAISGQCNWDGYPINNAEKWVARLSWSGTEWVLLDRPLTYSYASVCFKLDTYPVAAPAVALSILNRTHTASRTESLTFSDSFSFHPTETDTLSLSDSLSRFSETKDDTASVSSSADPTASVSVSSDPSATISQSINSESHSVSRSPPKTPTRTIPPTKTPTRTRSLNETDTLTIPPTKTPTRSRTASDNATHSASENTPSATHILSDTHNNSETATVGNTVSRTHPTHSITSVQSESALTPSRTDSGPVRTPSIAATESRSKTIHNIVIPVKATLSEELRTATAVFAIAAGAGVVAVQQARLNSANSLAQCGTGEEIDAVPEFLESPTGMTIGEANIKYRRGTLLGNSLVVLGFIFANFLVGATVGLAAFGSVRRGLAALRFPSLAMLPLMILQPSTATSAAVMFFFPFNGRDVIASMIGGTMFLMIPVAFAFEVQRRINLRKKQPGTEQCLLVPVTAEHRKKQRKFWKAKIGAVAYDAVIWLGGYIATWRDRELHEAEVKLYDASLGKGGISRNGMKAARKRWKQYQRDYPWEFDKNPFVATWGEFFDDVGVPEYFLVDFIVSTLQGLAAGSAAGPTSRTVCYVALIGTIVVCLAQLVFVCTRRVGLSRIFQVYLVLAALVTLVAFVMALVKFLSREFNFELAATNLGLVQAVLGFVMALVGIFEVLDFAYSVFESMCSPEARRRREARKKKKANGQDGDSTDTDDLDEDALLGELLAKERAEEQKARELEQARLMEERTLEEQRQRRLQRAKEAKAREVRMNFTREEVLAMSPRQRIMLLIRQLSVDDPILNELRPANRRNPKIEALPLNMQVLVNNAKKKRRQELREAGLLKENDDDNNEDSDFEEFDVFGNKRVGIRPKSKEARRRLRRLRRAKLRGGEGAPEVVDGMWSFPGEDDDLLGSSTATSSSDEGGDDGRRGQNHSGSSKNNKKKNTAHLSSFQQALLTSSSIEDDFADLWNSNSGSNNATSSSAAATGSRRHINEDFRDLIEEDERQQQQEQQEKAAAREQMQEDLIRILCREEEDVKGDSNNGAQQGQEHDDDAALRTEATTTSNPNPLAAHKGNDDDAEGLDDGADLLQQPRHTTSFKASSSAGVLNSNNDGSQSMRSNSAASAVSAAASAAPPDLASTTRLAAAYMSAMFSPSHNGTATSTADVAAAPASSNTTGGGALDAKEERLLLFDDDEAGAAGQSEADALEAWSRNSQHRHPLSSTSSSHGGAGSRSTSAGGGLQQQHEHDSLSSSFPAPQPPPRQNPRIFYSPLTGRAYTAKELADL